LREPWQLHAFYLLFGFTFGGCGLVPISTIVARWFNVRRPQALAIASTGLSLGGVVLTPLSALAIKQLGLAGAAPWLGLAFFLGVVPATALIVRPRPQAMGLEPDGAERRSDGAAATLPGIPFSQAWRTRYYVAVTGAYVFALGAQVGGIAHIYRLASIRADDQVAALAVALFAAISLAGRLASGWLMMSVPLRAFALALMAIQAIGLALLAHAVSGPGILVATAFFGLTSGTILMMQQLLLADAFGTREYGRIYSVSLLLTVIGVAAGPAHGGRNTPGAGGDGSAFLALARASLIGIGSSSASVPGVRASPDTASPTKQGSGATPSPVRTVARIALSAFARCTIRSGATCVVIQRAAARCARLSSTPTQSASAETSVPASLNQRGNP
jgi:hypothetical protein